MSQGQEIEVIEREEEDPEPDPNGPYDEGFQDEAGEPYPTEDGPH